MKPSTNDNSRFQGQPASPHPKDDRPAELDELNFEDDDYHARAGEPAESTDVEHFRAEDGAQEAGLSGAAAPGGDASRDELTPETLLPEDGSRSPREPGGQAAAEWELTEKFDVGGGHGLDEAELARLDPLDKKPWDGDADEPLTPLAEADDEDSFADDDEDDEDDEEAE